MFCNFQLNTITIKNNKDASEEGDSAISGTSNEDSESISPAERSLLQKIIRKGLVENKNDLEIQRKDPNSPLYHVKTFEELHLKPLLLKGLYDMGYNAPSKIQVCCFTSKFTLSKFLWANNVFVIVCLF